MLADQPKNYFSNSSSSVNVNKMDNMSLIIRVLNAPLMLISVISNSLVFAAISRTPSLRSPSTIFLCSIAVSDLLVGFVLQPVSIAFVFNPGNLKLREAYNMSALSLCGVSHGTMTVISVDRFLAVHCHMRYPILMTEKRAIHTTVSLWFICIPLSCIHFGSRNYYRLVLPFVS